MKKLAIKLWAVLVWLWIKFIWLCKWAFNCIKEMLTYIFYIQINISITINIHKD